MNTFIETNPDFDLNLEEKKQWWEILKAKSEKNQKTIQVDLIISICGFNKINKY